MLFRFKKVTATGELIAGEKEFFSLQEAQMKLIESGELLLELKAVSTRNHYHFTIQDRLEFTYQLHQLVSAGLPIYESLLSMQEKRLKYNFILEQLASSIREGKSFSMGLAQFPQSFDPLYISIIKASEASGEIKEGFFALKTLLEKQTKLIKILKNAFVYPSILLVFAFLIVNALIFLIIPSLKELFEGREVNTLTQTVLGISQFCNENLLGLGFVFVLAIGSVIYCYKKNLLKAFLFKATKHIPFCRKLTMSLKFENFFSCLGMLLSRGITLKEALVLSKNVLMHSELEASVDRIIQEILMGKKLSESMTEPFPQVAKRLILLSESTGRMHESCLMLALIFQEDVEKKLQQLTSFLQPILLSLIGMIIGVVILSILIPLTDVGSFI